MAGVSLLEMMVAVAVLGIIAAIAAPDFNQLTRRSRLTASSNELVAAMQLGRMEALRRNTRVSVCASADGAGCSGSSWNRVVVLAGAEVVRDVSLSDRVVATGDAAVVANANRIDFQGNGFASVGNNVRSGAVTLCVPGLPANLNSMTVDVNVSRVNVTRVAAGRANCQ